MNPFKCRHCSKDAHFYFRNGGMLCVDHGALHATAQMRDMLARSRLSASPPDSCGEGAAVDIGLAKGASAVAANSACATLEAPPGTSSAALSGSSGTPGQDRPLTPFDDLPIFPERKKATASRVIASSATQVPKSSSDIPNHHQ